MGCSASVPLNDPLRVTDEMKAADASCLYLTNEQKVAIRETWRRVHAKGALTIGKRVFLHIFELKPETKNHFPFRDAWGDELLEHAQFRHHVTRFVRTIDDVVANVRDDKGEIGMKMRTLGEVHAKGSVIDVAYFDVFATAILAILHQELVADFSAETKTAWTRLLGYVTHQVKEGYKDAMARSQNSSTESVVDIAVTQDATQPEHTNGV